MTFYVIKVGDLLVSCLFRTEDHGFIFFFELETIQRDLFLLLVLLHLLE